MVEAIFITDKRMKIEEYRMGKKYKEGAIKRKLGIKAKETVSPGSMITKANDLKKLSNKKRLAVLGLI